MHVVSTRLLVVLLLLSAIGLSCTKLSGGGGVKYPPSWLMLPPAATLPVFGCGTLSLTGFLTWLRTSSSLMRAGQEEPGRSLHETIRYLA